MSPHPWATDGQATYLHGWMGDFISRQGEGKLHLFWPPMFEGWFSRWPEEATLCLPLPSDRTARALTDEELVLLGAAIVTKKHRLENWFRNQRKKIGNANTPAGGASGAILRSLFRQLAPKRRRAHKPTEIFQTRNKEPIRLALDKAGFNAVGLSKSDRMRMRTRVANALWAEASAEEVDAVEAEVEREKKEIQEEEADSGKRRTPRDFQDGIDVLEQVYRDVHTATYNASGWVGMSIMGGPNPRMNGELSMKIICFGQTPAGNDFEDSCVDFDRNLTEPFAGFLGACYTAQQRAERALPARPTAADGPGATRTDAREGTAKTTKSKKKKTSKGAAVATAATSPTTPTTPDASTPTNPPPIPVEIVEPWLADTSPGPDDGDDSSLDDDTFFPGLFHSPPRAEQADDMFSFDPAATEPSLPLAAFNPWPAGMPPPPSPATAMAIADAERGIPSGARMAIDPMLDGASSPSPVSLRPAAPVVARPKPRASYRGASHALSGGLDPASPLATTKVGGFNFPQSTPSSGVSFGRPSVLFGAVGGRAAAAAAGPSLFATLPATPSRSPLPAGFASRTAHAMASIIGAIGPTDGEPFEQAWAHANPIPGATTREMGPGHRQDYLEGWSRKNSVRPSVDTSATVPPAPPPPPPPPPPSVSVFANGGLATTVDAAAAAVPVILKPKAAPVLPASRPHIKPPGAGKREVSGDGKRKQAAAAAKKKEDAAVRKREKEVAAARKRAEAVAEALKEAEGEAALKEVEAEVARREAEAEAEAAPEAPGAVSKRGKGRPRKSSPVQEGEEGGQSDEESGEGGEVAAPAAVGADAPPLADASNAGRPTRTRKATRFVDGSAVTLPVKSKRGAKKGDAVPETVLAGDKRKRGDENAGVNTQDVVGGWGEMTSARLLNQRAF
ncbi:hypothetical protein FB451DRAFT_1556369 [Mycena latifolia]|nr:hypothetical protein FB451DRAFT_1556369 [Mycena latifolia]